jgi:predicted phosphodiesterase
MRIATYGDLHLSHDPVLDKFRGREGKLLRFDEHLKRSHEKIVLMGDVFQTDYGAYPGPRPEILERIMARYPRIIRRWREGPYQIIFGNHDRITHKLLGTVKQIQLKKDGWRLWFIHGHQFDPFIKEKKFPYLVTWMIGGLRRGRLRCLADFLEGPFYDFGQRLLRSLDLAARREILGEKNDVIIMGHSHQLACQPCGKGLYVNSGDCFCEFLKYVSIDTRTRTVEIRVFIPPRGYQVLHRWSGDPSARGPADFSPAWRRH